jgi:uncharacterized protein (DUF2336 family)
LRFCVALSDDDMLDILRGHPDSWIVQAIAGRKDLSEGITDAIFETGDEPGTALMLANPGAQIGDATLNKIVERARNYPEWHKPVALRKELSVDIARRLTGFVNATVLDVLKKRSDFDAATRAGIVAIVQRRIEYQQGAGAGETAEQKVERYATAKRLTPDVLLDSLSWQETDFAVGALSRMSGIPAPTVKRMLSAGPKPIIAVCWKAGLSPRVCVDIQRLAGRLQPKDLIYARGGTEYALKPEEIRWQLEFFGVKT